MNEQVQKLIHRCEECKFATCENCEINWKEVQAVRALFNSYRELLTKFQETKSYVKELLEEYADISLAQSCMEYSHKEVVEIIETMLTVILKYLSNE